MTEEQTLRMLAALDLIGDSMEVVADSLFRIEERLELMTGTTPDGKWFLRSGELREEG